MPKFKPKARPRHPRVSDQVAEDMISGAVPFPERANLMSQMFNLVAQSMTPSMTEAENSEVQAEINGNLDYYLQEHRAEIDQAIQRRQAAQRLLQQASQVPTYHMEEDDVFDWEEPDAFNQP